MAVTMAANITLNTVMSCSIELRRQLVGAAEAGALQHEAEAQAEQQGHDQAELTVLGHQRFDGKAHVHCLLTK